MDEDLTSPLPASFKLFVYNPYNIDETGPCNYVCIEEGMPLNNSIFKFWFLCSTFH